MGEQLSQSIEALLEAKRHSLLNSTNSFSNLTKLILRQVQ